MYPSTVLHLLYVPVLFYIFACEGTAEKHIEVHVSVPVLVHDILYQYTHECMCTCIRILDIFKRLVLPSTGYTVNTTVLCELPRILPYFSTSNLARLPD